MTVSVLDQVREVPEANITRIARMRAHADQTDRKDTE